MVVDTEKWLKMLFEIVRLDTGSTWVWNRDAKGRDESDEGEGGKVRRKGRKDGKIWYK